MRYPVQALSVHKSVSHGVTCDESYDPKKTLTCDKCGKTFSTAKCLNDHCNQEHPSLEKIASVNCKCEAPCNLEFETAQDLNSHLVICNIANSKNSEPLKNFTCDKCNLSNWHSSNALRFCPCLYPTILTIKFMCIFKCDELSLALLKIEVFLPSFCLYPKS